jgi:hypothetical protein
MHAAAALEDPDPVRTSMHCIDMWLERLVIAEHLRLLPHDAVTHLKQLKSGIAFDTAAAMFFTQHMIILLMCTSVTFTSATVAIVAKTV